MANRIEKKWIKIKVRGLMKKKFRDENGKCCKLSRREKL